MNYVQPPHQLDWSMFTIAPQPELQQQLQLQQQPLHKRMAIEFLKNYYAVYDNNFYYLANIYCNNPMIIFLHDAVNNFQELYSKIVLKYGISKFNHHNIVFETQPIGDNLLIEITGELTINDAHHLKFVETLVFVKLGAMYYVSNSIKRIII